MDNKAQADSERKMELYFDLPIEDLPAKWQDSQKIKQEIATELKAQGISAEVDWKPDPRTPEKKDRELVLAILAVGAASVMVAHAVKKVLDNLNPAKPTVVYEKKSEPVVDPQGKPVLGKDGKPLMKYSETPVVVPSNSSDSVSLTAFKVFEIRSASETQSGDEKARKGAQGPSTSHEHQTGGHSGPGDGRST